MMKYNPIMVALDFSDIKDVEDFLKLTQGEIEWAKIGMELYYAFGPRIIDVVKKYQVKIFLDLKLHDIPNTVHKSLINLCRNQIDMVNVHISGGQEMLKEARRAIDLNSHVHKPLLIGVTQLTSTGSSMLRDELLINQSMDEVVLHYAKLAYAAKLDGVVCSAQEAKIIKEHTHPDFLCVTPGIRLIDDNQHDQKRTMTPDKALSNGSNYLVIGRPITQALAPLATIQKIKKTINYVT